MGVKSNIFSAHRKSGNIGFLTAITICFTVGVHLLLIQCSNRTSEKITLVYSNKVNYEPFILATDKGYYKDEGLDVEVRTVVGGIVAAEAIATGSANIAAMGDAPAIIVASRNKTLKIVARYGSGEGIHRIVTQKNITEPEHLEGKKVGIQPGSSTHGAFLSWLEKNGLGIENINIVPLNPLDMPDAMFTEQIDAIAGSEPWPTNVRTRCGDKVRELSSSEGLGNTFPHVLVVSEKLLLNNPRAVEKILTALTRAVAYINENIDESAQLISAYTGLPPETQKVCMGRLSWHVAFDSTDYKSMARTASFLKDFGKIELIPDFTEIVDTSFLKEIHDQ
jgi:NitT/TauT family transport system substrate-binding protein